ncbi:MAG: MFS transporter [Chloroflexi bacterium]|nr:MFS transporter [Chloroflexota bacterium]
MRGIFRSITSAYYGWYVVAALFFMTFIAVGSRQGFGVFVKTWEEEFDTSLTMISVAAALGWLVNGVVQPFFGNFADRFGAKPVILISLIVMGFGTIAMSLMTNVFMLIFLFGFVVSFASGGIMFTTTGTIVARWFRRKRGTAISVLTSGGSVGGLLLVPFAAYVLILSDWRVSWAVMGGLILLLGLPVILLVVRGDPKELGLNPDGDDEEANAASVAVADIRGPLTTENWRDSFASPPMWQLSLGFLVCGITTASIAVHYVRWAEDQSISPGTAALAFGLLSGINAIAVIAIGWLSDKMQRKTLLGIVYLIRAAAFLSLILLPGNIGLWVFAVVGGGSWLATVPLTTSLTADVYGVRALGTLTGLITMSHQLGGAAAVLIFGLVFDAFGTYDPAFWGGFVTLLFAGAISFSIRERRYSVRFVQPGDLVITAPAKAD